MKMDMNHIILNYKSKLFDLVETAGKNDVENWISIITNSFNASQVAYYTRDIENKNQFVLKSSYSLDESPQPEAITADILSRIFKDEYVIDQVRLGAFPEFSLFNIAFRFIYKNQEKGCLLLHLPLQCLASYDPNVYIEFIRESARFLYIMDKLSVIVAEERNYKELFRVTEKFHSSMSIDTVLHEIINVLKRMFPECQYYLMLSNDYHYKTDLPIKTLHYDSADENAMESYVNGEICMTAARESKHTTLYAPLLGKQGVYGVLEIVSAHSLVFNKNEIEFIRLLANTAGGALENAKLYQQSTRLVEDLQLINETSMKLNASSRLEDTLQFLHMQISRSFHVQDIAFVMLHDNSCRILDGSSPVFHEPEGKIYLDFVFESLKREKDAIFISDFNSKFVKGKAGYSSLMAVPMIERDEIKGFCIMIHKNAYNFTFEMFKLFRSLIHHSTLAITNSMLREELEKLVITDHLTQLFAKNYLNSQMEESMNKDEEGTFILLDIDNFKEVNDTHGHQVGDKILVQVARIIEQNIRASDIGARWGGEELAIYLPGVPLNIGEEVAKRLHKAVSENTSPKITISCGVSYWNKDREDRIENLFNRADIGLYNAKNSGKDQVVVTENCRQIM
jgi:diguanylate cyclase (GGDEF)-like protein